MLDDTKIVHDELILSFTHNTVIPFMLPGIPPTGKYVELAHVVVMKFRGNKIVHEHIYWNQASLLVQIGLMDAKDLPITGIEQSRTLQELSSQKMRETKGTRIFSGRIKILTNSYLHLRILCATQWLSSLC